VRWLVHLTLGWHRAWGVGLLGVLARGVGLLGILTLRRVSAGGDPARGIGLVLGFPCSRHAGSEFGRGEHKCVLDASGLGGECDGKKSDPVAQKHEPVQPRKGLERLVLRAEACKLGIDRISITVTKTIKTTITASRTTTTANKVDATEGCSAVGGACKPEDPEEANESKFTGSQRSNRVFAEEVENKSRNENDKGQDGGGDSKAWDAGDGNHAGCSATPIRGKEACGETHYNECEATCDAKHGETDGVKEGHAI
jgi:hypothetical protein